MSFQEKSTWISLATVFLIYGWYFGTTATELGGNVADIDYQSTMLFTVVAVVVVSVILNVVVVFADPDASDTSDERDRSINRFGEYVGGYVLAAGALLGLGLAMAEIEQFWIANAILLGLVLSELTSGVVKVVAYRRGF